MNPSATPLRLVATPAELILNPAPRTAGETNDLLARARAWNQSHGLTAAALPPPSASPTAPAPGASTPSWWWSGGSSMGHSSATVNG